MTRRSCVVALAAAASLAVSGQAHAAEPVYYTAPTGVSVSQGIAAAPNGDIWFAAGSPYNGSQPVTAIARLRPSAASPGTSNGFATFPTPIPMSPTPGCCANRVISVAYDSVKDRVWFVQNDGVVGLGDPSQMTDGSSSGMLATRLAGRQSLYDVAIAKGGDGAFITENSADNSSNYYGNRIAYVTSALAVQEFDNIAQQSPSGSLDSLRYDAKPMGITVDAGGSPWFAESDPGNPGYRIARGIAGGGPRGAGGYEEYLVQPCGSGSPCSGSYTGTGVTDVAVAKDGAKWFTNQLKNQIGRLDGSSFTSFDLATIDPGLAGGQARAITAAPDGTLWAVQYGGYGRPTANAIIRIDPTDPAAPTATVYHLGAGRYPFAVAPDDAGNIWFTVGTDSAPNLIGEIPGVIGGAPDTGGGSTTTPTTPTTSTSTSTTPVTTTSTTPAATTTTTTAAATTPAPTATSGPTPVVIRPVTVAPARVDPPAVDHASVLADQVCAARDGAGQCTVVYIISAGEYVTAFPGAKIRATTKAKRVVLTRMTVTTNPGTRKKVRITLGAKGRKLLKARGKLRVYFTATRASTGGQPPTVLRKARLTLKR